MKNKCYIKQELMLNALTFKMVLLSLFFLFSRQVDAQEVEADNKNALEPRLTFSDFSYPKMSLFSTEQHSSFKFSYRLTPKFFLELQGFYDSYLLADVFKMPLTSKLYVTNKLYLFSGIEMEMERDKMQLNLPPPQLKSKNGVGYDVTNSLFLQVQQDLHFDQSVIGVYGIPKLLSINGKYKF